MRAALGLGVCLGTACAPALPRSTVQGHRRRLYWQRSGTRANLGGGQGMHLRRQWWSGLVATVLGGLVSVTAVAAGGEQFIPVLSIREGALRVLGIPQADG